MSDKPKEQPTPEQLKQIVENFMIVWPLFITDKLHLLKEASDGK
jgi:hypothetical protein